MRLSTRTSGVALHFEKHKACDASVNGLQRHNERTEGSGKHSNKRIDDARTADNVILKRSDGTYYEQVSAIIDRNRDGGLKGVRKDAVRMCEATVQLSGQVLDRSDAEQERVLRQSYDWLKETFGADNIVSATIHKDETNMHLHVDFVPIKDGKLTAKTILSKGMLHRYQTDFLKHLQQSEPTLNFIRGSSEYNGLPQDVYEQLQDERREMMAELDERETALDDHQTALDDRETALDARQSDLTALDAQLRQKGNNLLKTQNTLLERAKALDNREKALNDRETALDTRETALEALGKDLSIREQKAVERENTASDREQALDDREQALDDRDKHQKTTQIDIERQQQDLTKRENKAIMVDKSLRHKHKEILTSTERLERIKADNQQVLDGVTSATTALRDLMDKGLRLTTIQKRDLHDRLERHKPITPTTAPALEHDIREFMDGLDSLGQDKGDISL